MSGVDPNGGGPLVVPGPGGGGGGVAPYLLGPFSLAAIEAGSAPDPGDSDPQLAGYGGVEAFLPMLRAGSLTGLTVTLSESASGSDVIVLVAVGEEPVEGLTVTIEQPGRTARVTIAAGTVPIAEGDQVAVVALVGSGWNSAAGFAAALEFTPS